MTNLIHRRLRERGRRGGGTGKNILFDAIYRDAMGGTLSVGQFREEFGSKWSAHPSGPYTPRKIGWGEPSDSRHKVKIHFRPQ